MRNSWKVGRRRGTHGNFCFYILFALDLKGKKPFKGNFLRSIRGGTSVDTWSKLDLPFICMKVDSDYDILSQ